MGGAEHGLPTDFAEEVLDLVARVPVGRVVTYGDVAELLGRGGARAVGTVMSRFGADVPWWRVIRAGGWAPQGHDAQALVHYREEGTPLLQSGSVVRVDLPRARWTGE